MFFPLSPLLHSAASPSSCVAQSNLTARPQRNLDASPPEELSPSAVFISRLVLTFADPLVIGVRDDGHRAARSKFVSRRIVALDLQAMSNEMDWMKQCCDLDAAHHDREREHIALKAIRVRFAPHWSTPLKSGFVGLYFTELLSTPAHRTATQPMFNPAHSPVLGTAFTNLVPYLALTFRFHTFQLACLKYVPGDPLSR
ncbi:hypothetical protein B0H16DRAFT_1473461 [Mycena metata]|uniref:Uncharacterized protein n=1 Tax=Mycena metata TaxID=1033252 RepID=A0AAD7HJH3_9AGAR|nr:hypothetical protein B0H16DRAFT_1473461 [Mycena metata]